METSWELHFQFGLLFFWCCGSIDVFYNWRRNKYFVWISKSFSQNVGATQNLHMNFHRFFECVRILLAIFSVCVCACLLTAELLPFEAIICVHLPVWCVLPQDAFSYSFVLMNSSNAMYFHWSLIDAIAKFIWYLSNACHNNNKNIEILNSWKTSCTYVLFFSISDCFVDCFSNVFFFFVFWYFVAYTWKRNLWRKPQQQQQKKATNLCRSADLSILVVLLHRTRDAHFIKCCVTFARQWCYVNVCQT